ncbi:MAG TPA: condensation domain-containing protein, partial [Terriglobales bacterium]
MKPSVLSRIASQLSDAGKISKAIDSRKSERVVQSPYVAPRNPVEEVLSGQWAQLLHLDKLGINDNFFECGGNSLLATQAMSRVRQAFALEMPLRVLFETPTVAGLAQRIESERHARRDSRVPAIVPVPRDTHLPPSFAQQRLWFLDQLEPGRSFYNVFQALRFEGALVVDALERALNHIIARHEVLRTTFANTGDQPAQVIAPPVDRKLAVSDLGGLQPRERESEAQRLASEEAHRPFDLSRGPLLRASLVRLGGEEHLLFLNLHHVVSDRWSIGILSQELAALYEAYRSNQSPALPDLPVQYADFAVWQRQWLKGAVLEEQLAYWKSQLAGAPAMLELATDRPRPAVQSFRGGMLSHQLSVALSEQLEGLSRREGATLFMTMMAAFQLLLARYSGREDIVVGTPIAARNHAEIESLIGFFVNTLPLRADLSGNPTFRELLQQVRERSLGAYAHQELPFERLVEELRLERSLSHNPLVQVSFAFQNAPLPRLELPGLKMTNFPVESGTAVFDLSLFVGESPEGLRLRVEYNSDLFDRLTAARMLGHYQRLLEEIAAAPEQKVSDYSLLDDSERRQLTAWSDNTCDFTPVCVDELFDRQAQQTPQANAVSHGDEELTYAELNHRANRLAHYLRKRGVGPEMLVAICMDRSIEMVVAMLGVLKAGGAYLPLDPGYPKERIAFILQDAQAPVLLT